jgi:hypothetical protein
MPHFYFDTRDGPDLIRDEIGLELDGIEDARDEATRGIADLARDALPGAVRRELSVQVRDEAARDVLRASLWFEVAVLVDKANGPPPLAVPTAQRASLPWVSAALVQARRDGR